MTIKKFWTMKSQANSSGNVDAELILYGVIGDMQGWDDVTSADFANDITSLGNVSNINVRINSPGGDTFAAAAIYNTLKRSTANVNVYIDGLAASAASVVAMAGDKVFMPPNSMMMIHNPWTFAMGEADDMRKTADTLDAVKLSVIAAYKEKSGMTENQLSQLMDAETWLSADEAVEMGFADEVERQEPVSAMMIGTKGVFNGMTFDLGKFKNIPPKLSKANMDNLTNNGGDRKMSTVESLQKEQPEIFNSVLATGREEGAKTGHEDGIKNERARMAALDKLEYPGYEEIINKAKYETFESAADTAIKILDAMNAKRKSAAADRKEDAIGSGVNNVESDMAANEKVAAMAAQNEVAKAIAGIVNKKRGGKANV